MRLPTILLGALGLVLCACAMDMQDSHKLPANLPIEPGRPTGKTEKMYVAAGCFWCIEGQFEMLKGVSNVTSGYCGGNTTNPTYEQVSTGQTGHAEAVEVSFDPGVISAENLLRIFFVSHDPTQLNRQGPDVGTQYRSTIFYRTNEERVRAEGIKQEILSEGLFKGKVVTTIEPLGTFYKAEEYHQDYFVKFERATPEQRAKMNAGYCSYVVSPKITKFREQFAKLLKER